MAAGSYILVLKSDTHASVVVGKLGTITLRPGYYLYIGSAMGSGGIAARLGHHSKISRKPHWHIDYLRAETHCLEAWALESVEKQECEWASIVAASAAIEMPMKGFGASDCGCRTHLFFLPRYPDLAPVLASISAANAGLVRVSRGL